MELPIRPLCHHPRSEGCPILGRDYRIAITNHHQHLGFDLPVQTTGGPHQSRMESDSAADGRPTSRELKRGNATLAESYGADAVRVDTAQVRQEFKRGVRTFEQQTWC